MKLNSKLIEWLKWALLVFVLFLILINYFAFIEILQHGCSVLDDVMNSYGYHFGVTAPFIFIFKFFIPSLGVISYVSTLDNKNFIAFFKKLYETVTIGQLAILAVVLPCLLFAQNRFFGKITNNYGTK